MEIETNGTYDLITNGVQRVPITVNINTGSKSLTLKSVFDITVVDGNVSTASDNRVTVHYNKYLFYNTVANHNIFCLCINKDETGAVRSDVYKYILGDWPTINKKIIVTNNGVDGQFLNVDYSGNGFTKYDFDFGILGITSEQFN